MMDISEYERERAANMARNEAYLKAIGLLSETVPAAKRKYMRKNVVRNQLQSGQKRTLRSSFESQVRQLEEKLLNRLREEQNIRKKQIHWLESHIRHESKQVVDATEPEWQTSQATQLHDWSEAGRGKRKRERERGRAVAMDRPLVEA